MNLDQHEAIRDLLAAVALGAAAPEEVARVDAHVATCPLCAEEMESYRATATLLATSVPQQMPDPDLRRRILRDLPRAQAPLPVRRQRAWFRGWPSLAAGLAVSVLALGTWTLARPNESSRDIPVTSKLASANPTVRLTESDGRRTVLVRFDRLPKAAAGRGWELWSIRGGKPRSEGFMRIQPDGSAMTVVEAGDVQAVALTNEPLGNTVGPTGDQVVVASITG